LKSLQPLPPFPESIRVTSELKTFNQRRSYSTSSPHRGPNKDVKILHPSWVTGYIDACFRVNVCKSNNVKLGYSVILIY